MTRTPAAMLALAGALVIVTVTTIGASPDQWYGGPEWQPHAHAYHPSTVETITGTVLRVERVVERVTPLRGISEGVDLILQTARETIRVHVGPTWYVEHHDPAIGAGDRVHVTGSRVEIDSAPAIIAARLRKRSATLVLRDQNGYPMWDDPRRR